MGANLHRRLVVMFDGTWNEKDDWTNVARMYEAIDNGPVEDGVEQIVKYFPGVGTAFIGKILGGSFGYGLSDIIKQGYLWCSENYRDGDEIFVFGFSRGAYSARSFVSMLHEVGGVLKKPSEGHVTEALVEQAYKLYRNDMKPSHPVMKAFANEHCYPVRVKMLGVWDTVGALGVPDSAFKSNTWYGPALNLLSFTPLSRKNYMFHDQNLSCIVDEAYHALAIDEHREDFAPTLWDAMREENKVLEQCWFVGSHCNCGGGIEGDDLWQLAYEWMQEKAISNGLRYKWTYKAGEQWPHWRTQTEDSFRNMLGGAYAYWKGKEFSRTIGQSVGETLHWSVAARIQKNPNYQPKGLKITDPITNGKKWLTELPYKKPPVSKCSCQEEETTPVALHSESSSDSDKKNS